MRVSVVGSLSILIVLFMLQACAPKPQKDCGFVMSASQQRVSLKGRTGFPLRISDTVPREFVPAIQKEVEEWKNETGRAFFSVVDTNYHDAGEPKQDGVSVVYWMTKWDSSRTDEQARTVIVWDQSSSQIVEADIKFNARDFKFYIDKPTGVRDVHFPSVAGHELGHVIGLKHRDDAPSLMSTELASNTVRDAPRPADLESIKCEYK